MELKSSHGVSSFVGDEPEYHDGHAQARHSAAGIRGRRDPGTGIGAESPHPRSHDGGRGTGESSGCGKLLALAEFSGELDHDDHGKFLLSLRGTEFAGEECRVLGLTCFDKTTTDCLSAIPA